ncbi:hypothetical protein [Marinibactrum halimedae]|uniref:Uncharacterized protein n=1 Tax=Marinibactrum halimedae TaxID=1444977 RepID=A0AA37WN77_9GAMM|nr:hypothetical protein [Marinibactrum halimedae]MCD9459231.1 hypothetical protein [Marinibactrum halimedae]GLS27303.1 hypothetical protein GCM10007877_30220 [Marinibactrum halimedae]
MMFYTTMNVVPKNNVGPKNKAIRVRLAQVMLMSGLAFWALGAQAYEKTIEKTVDIYYNAKTGCQGGKTEVLSVTTLAESKHQQKPDAEVLPDDYEAKVRIDTCGVKGVFLVWLRYQAPWYTILSQTSFRSTPELSQ